MLCRAITPQQQLVALPHMSMGIRPVIILGVEHLSGCDYWKGPRFELEDFPSALRLYCSYKGLCVGVVRVINCLLLKIFSMFILLSMQILQSLELIKCLIDSNIPRLRN